MAGTWTYWYRAVDSTGATIDFLLSARRDATAAKRFFQKALRSPIHPRPRVINVRRTASIPKSPSVRKSGIPSLSLGVANTSGNRDDEHDSEGTSQMVAEERRCRAGRIRWTPVGRHDVVIAGTTQVSFTVLFHGCNTTCKTVADVEPRL
jgi:hypothetical protein